MPFIEVVYEIDGRKYIDYQDEKDLFLEKVRELYMIRYYRWEIGGNEKIHKID